MTLQKENYVDSIKEYQDKMYMPGYYTGGNIHPALRAKTKAGGYGMVIGGGILLFPGLFQLLTNFSIWNIGALIYFVVSILMIIVGIKLIRQISQK